MVNSAQYAMVGTITREIALNHDLIFEELKTLKLSQLP